MRLVYYVIKATGCYIQLWKMSEGLNYDTVPVSVKLLIIKTQLKYIPFKGNVMNT